MTRILRIWLFMSLFCICWPSIGQISHGGKPIFKGDNVKTSVRPFELPPFKMSFVSAFEQKQIGKRRLKIARYAYRFNVDYNINEHGKWDTLTDGRRVWRIAIRSKGAFSLGILFSDFKIPEGGQVFVYSMESERVLGAYTEKNNKNSGVFAIEPLKGDNLILEYIEPVNPAFPARLRIGGILHDYKNVFNMLRGDASSKASGSCNININCPEGNNWQVEKRSVCHILTNGDKGSGALINNTNADGRPFLLTANHVISDVEDAENSIFFFNYEDSQCDATDGAKSQSISGSALLATTPNLDFALLELSVAPPSSFMPFYAGWDRSGREPANTTCIHHPNGDTRKISIDNDFPVTGTYNFDLTFDSNTHWQILDWEVGTTEGGSSGSPLFDENHRIIGDLTGGEANCSNSVNDFYAKFSESWANYPDTDKQLKFWLDPLNLGNMVLDGLDPYINASADTICISSQVTFSYLSADNLSDYFWDFGEGAIPESSVEEGPHTITYTTNGSKEITLIVDKEGEITSFSKEILVMDSTVADFDYTLELQTVSMINNSMNTLVFNWDFGDGETSDLENPVHSFDLSGNYTVTLTVENVCGSNSFSREIKTSYNDQLKIYPNPSFGLFTIDLSNVTYSQASWSIWDSKGSKIMGNNLSNLDNVINFNLEGLSAGTYLFQLIVDGEVLKRKLLLAK